MQCRLGLIYLHHLLSGTALSLFEILFVNSLVVSIFIFINIRATSPSAAEPWGWEPSTLSRRGLKSRWWLESSSCNYTLAFDNVSSKTMFGFHLRGPPGGALGPPKPGGGENPATSEVSKLSLITAHPGKITYVVHWVVHQEVLPVLQIQVAEHLQEENLLREVGIPLQTHQAGQDRQRPQPDHPNQPATLSQPAC